MMTFPTEWKNEIHVPNHQTRYGIDGLFTSMIHLLFFPKKNGDFPVRYAELPGGNRRQLGVHLRTLDVFFSKKWDML